LTVQKQLIGWSYQHN